MSYKQIGRPGSIQKIKGADFYDVRYFSDDNSYVIDYTDPGSSFNDNNENVFLDFTTLADIAFPITEVRSTLIYNGSLTFRAQLAFQFVDSYDRSRYELKYSDFITVEGDAGSTGVAYIPSFLFSQFAFRNIATLKGIILSIDQDGSGPHRTNLYHSKSIFKHK